MKPELTQARLKELLQYDPETGVFTWRATRGGRAKAGDVAGSLNYSGYRIVSIDSCHHRAHRLAFLYMGGASPDGEVDHINRDPADNRWTNLRVVTRSENLRNTGVSSRNTSGYRGVYWRASCSKWLAYGWKEGKRLFFGHYETIEEAASVVQKWREENFGISAAA